MTSLDKLQSADFLPCINQTFRIQLNGSGSVDLELVNVTEADSMRRPERAAPAARQPFSLHFLGPVSSQYLAQHIYRLEHAQLGAFDLFIVPLGPEAGRMRYEAIFA
ncbi:MAG: hypothetical protein HND47_07405 [Chloroflexi bacterium]|nr:hypothetical protein [Chloroflexota bacterium]